MLQIEVTWQGRKRQFPYRIYTEISKSEVQTTNDFEKLSLYTRHHNGHIREIAIIELMQKFPSDNIPFLVQLLGEFVVEIHQRISQEITSQQKNWIQEFLQENPKYAQTIRSKVASYWDCYYKWEYVKLKDYPAFKLINDQ